MHSNIALQYHDFMQYSVLAHLTDLSLWIRLMKTLHIESIHREYLMSKGALCVDADEWETLIGLTPSESVTYLKMEQRAATGYLSDDILDLQFFLVILNKHEAAFPAV
jgi:hypothetical protein